MDLTASILNMAQSAVDLVTDLWPADQPPATVLKAAKIVAHRGAFGPGPKENLCTSLEACASANIWGAEFDVRWTPDEVPVLMHDPLPDRSLADPLRRAVASLGGKTHLMIEMKEPVTPDRELALQRLLGHLKPVSDFHFLTLNPSFLEACRIFPKCCFIYVTELRPGAASEYVLENGWGGLAGHYLLMSDRLVARHKAAGQSVGVGFVASPNNLCRQLGRDVDWLFSNNAPLLQAWLDARLDGPERPG